MQIVKLLRASSASLFTVALGAVSFGTSVAQSAPQWREYTYALPGPNWHVVSPDPDPNYSGKRLVMGEREPLHDVQIILATAEAPAALAPSEVATRYFNQLKADTSSEGTFSDAKIDSRTIAGVSYPTYSDRYTPNAGPPITDQTELLIFPSDYDQRQRWLVVRWIDTNSATTGPKALDDLDSLVSSLSTTPLGSVLVTDDFSDPIHGVISDAQSSEHYDVGLKEGELSIYKNDPTSDAIYVVGLPGNYADTSLSVDAHMNGNDFGSVQHLYCRRSSDGSYRIDLDQSDGSARLIRVGADGSSTELVPWTESAAIKIGPESNHLELICRGPSIELDSNGTKVFSARDTELQEGHGAIAVGGFPNADAIDEVRFANLVLTQR